MEKKNDFKDIPGMFEGSVLPVLIKLSVPLLAGMIVQLLYNITDTIFISRINLSDPSLVGGVGMIFPIMFMAIALSSGLMTGTSSLVARAIGEKNHKILEVTAESAIVIALFFSLVTVLVSYLFDEQIVSLMGARGDYAVTALAYLRFIIPAAVAAYIVNVIMGILQGEGQVKYIMNIMIIGTGLNIILDPIFIFLFDWGVAGAAAATSVAQFIALFYSFTPFLRKKVSMQIHWKVRNIRFSLMGKILSIGFPQALGMMLMSVSFLFLNRIVVEIDPLALTAFSLCGRFDQAVLMPSFALGSALITIMGQNGGRGNYKRMMKVWHISLMAGAVSVALIALGMVLLAPWIYSFFTDIPEVVDYAVRQTRILEFTFIFIMASIISRSGFQAVGYPMPALTVILLRLILISIPMAYLLVYVFDLGIYGVWFGMITGSMISMIVSIVWLGIILRQIIAGKREFRRV